MEKIPVKQLQKEMIAHIENAQESLLRAHVLNMLYLPHEELASFLSDLHQNLKSMLSGRWLIPTQDIVDFQDKYWRGIDVVLDETCLLLADPYWRALLPDEDQEGIISILGVELAVLRDLPDMIDRLFVQFGPDGNGAGHLPALMRAVDLQKPDCVVALLAHIGHLIDDVGVLLAANRLLMFSYATGVWKNCHPVQQSLLNRVQQSIDKNPDMQMAVLDDLRTAKVISLALETGCADYFDQSTIFLHTQLSAATRGSL